MKQLKPETALLRQVLTLARLMGWRTLHIRPGRTARGWRTPIEGDGVGWPDVVCVRERVVFIELKSDRGALTAEQEAWLDALRKTGAEVHVFRPSDWDEIEATLR